MYDIIINPIGGKGKSLKALAIVEETLKANGAQYTVHNTTHAGHATELARELSAKPDTKLIVMGARHNRLRNGQRLYPRKPPPRQSQGRNRPYSERQRRLRRLYRPRHSPLP